MVDMNIKDLSAEEEYLCRVITRHFKRANNITLYAISNWIIEDIIHDELFQSMKYYDCYNFSIVHDIFKQLNMIALYNIFKGYNYGKCIENTFYGKFEFFCSIYY